jgi:hypothetical protein
MLREKNNLIENRGLNNPINHKDALDDSQLFLIEMNNQGLLNNGIAYLPENPPFEFHPYKSALQLQNFDKYIIGTFPPISYVYDLIPLLRSINQPRIGNGRKIPKPGFPFFHGNKKLMWDYLLTNDELEEIPKNRELIRTYLIEKLNQMAINYSDIIDGTQRELAENRYKGSDYLLKNITINKELISHIFSNKFAKYLLFNTASIYGVGGMQFDENGLIDLNSDAKAFDLFLRSLQEYGCEIEIRISDPEKLAFPWTPISNLNIQQRSMKIAFELRILNPIGNTLNIFNDFEQGTTREFIVITPFSPAVAQRINLLAGNPVVANYLANNQEQDTRQMLYRIYQDFRNNNWNALFNYNA